MIKLIGIRRALLLAILLTVNLFVGAVYAFLVEPLREETDTKLSAATSEISRISGDTRNIKTELAVWPANYAAYQALRKNGFFQDQDRFQASHAMDALREKSNLLSYAYKFDTVKPVKNALADAAGADLLNSRITIDSIASVLDTDVYVFMHTFLKSFPPHVRVEKFDISRSKDVNEETLKELAKGPASLITAKIEMDWFTLAPKPADADGTALPAEGFRVR
jgi:hypothetical protein